MSDDLTKSLQAFARTGKANMKTVVRVALLDIFSQVVQRSPVGNPDLWKANAAQVSVRENYNTWAAEYNDLLGKKKGRLRKKSAKSLQKQYANKVGVGYVGGRFKNNWQVGIGLINSAVIEATNKSGSAAIGRAQGALSAVELGQDIYISNNLPYAYRLEYEGWSKQAPGGMIRLSLQNTSQAIAKAARSL